MPLAPLLHCQLFQFQLILKYSPCLECRFLCLRLKPVYSNDSHSYIPTLNSLICQSKSSQMLNNQQILSFWSLLKQFQEFKNLVIVCFLTNSLLELLKIVDRTYKIMRLVRTKKIGLRPYKKSCLYKMSFIILKKS